MDVRRLSRSPAFSTAGFVILGFGLLIVGSLCWPGTARYGLVSERTVLRAGPWFCYVGALLCFCCATVWALFPSVTITKPGRRGGHRER